MKREIIWTSWEGRRREKEKNIYIIRSKDKGI